MYDSDPESGRRDHGLLPFGVLAFSETLSQRKRIRKKNQENI